MDLKKLNKLKEISLGLENLKAFTENKEIIENKKFSNNIINYIPFKTWSVFYFFPEKEDDAFHCIKTIIDKIIFHNQF